MSRKHKSLVMVIFVFVFVATMGGCSTSLDPDANPQMVAAEDGGEQEVLDENDADDDDAFGRPEDRTIAGKAGGILASVGYLAFTVGSAVLPLLMIM
jgi:hypothetical protein